LVSLAELAAALAARRVSPVEATRECLDRIARLDPGLGAFITVTTEAAMEEARAAEAEIMAGRLRGPLHGVPIALKDLLDTAGVRTTGASAVFAERVPAEDAEVVHRLRAAGAVIVGKTNLHEVAYGASGVVSAFGPTRNPRNAAHIAGGSSSGSAAAVGAGMCYAAIGSDTSGSIRIPAALSGIVGMKPTYGLCSVRGVLPLSASYDTVGPMARTVGDAAIVLAAIAGYDAEDPWSVEVASPRGAAAGPPRIGLPRTPFFIDLDAEVAEAIDQAISLVTGIAKTVRDITITLDDDRTLFLAESHAVHRATLAAAPERFQAETLRRVRAGAAVTAAEYIAQRTRLVQLRRAAAALFTDVDLLVTPTVREPAPLLADLLAEPDRLRARELGLMRNTRPFNVLGLPTLSVPCGLTRAGLPIGLQIAGAPGADARVLAFGEAFERAQGRLDILSPD
jgi:Asp-tRNA(Asn)/Glu-tRNA(Gln) amidotransferase A subunit family amidase